MPSNLGQILTLATRHWDNLEDYLDAAVALAVCRASNGLRTQFHLGGAVRAVLESSLTTRGHLETTGKHTFSDLHKGILFCYQNN